MNPWKGLVRGNVDDDESDPGKEEVTDTLSREERDKKATKSDKAPVPIYLWEEHLVADGPSPWSVEQQKGLARAMEVARR